jgi:membrane-associated phospholipid phosphatase
MKKISAILFINRYYFFGCFLVLAGMVLFLLLTTKTQGFILLNPWHTKIADIFFMIYTNMGDGLFSIALFLLLLYFHRALLGWEIVISFLLSGLIAQLLKFAFPMPRPKTLLGNAHYAHFIDGYTHVGNASFPSGHTASAFGLATLLCLFSPDKKWGILYLLLAILVGYSRIYLGQHFLQDVLAGALIGIASAISVYLVIEGNDSWFVKIKAAERKRHPGKNQ